MKSEKYKQLKHKYQNTFFENMHQLSRPHKPIADGSVFKI